MSFRVMPTFDRYLGIVVACLAIGTVGSAQAAPFAQQIPFTQPDGSQIVIWGRR